MDGTHMPTKIPACLSPLNHKNSEKIKDKKAAMNIKKSVGVNFLNMNEFDLVQFKPNSLLCIIFH
jgi:hypothetical protein